MNYLRIIASVFYKDLRIMLNYKMNLLMTVISIFVYLFFIYSISKSFSISDNLINNQSINTFAFLLTGLMVIDFTITCSVAAPLNINFYQTSGILDELIHDEKGFTILSISSLAFPFFFSIFKFFLYFIVSFLFFEMELIFNSNIIILLIFIFIYLIFLMGLGLLAASITLIFKRGNPIIRLNTLLTAMLGGAIFPTQALGAKFELLSFFIPGTHMIEIIRQVLTNENLEIAILNLNFIALIIFSISSIITGYFCFIYALRYTKIKNTTSDY